MSNQNLFQTPSVVNTPADGRYNPPPPLLDFNPREYPLFPAGAGWRHPQLVGFAGHLRYFGVEEDQLAEQLFEADRRYDSPPKPPGEIRKLAHYAAEHWQPGEGPTGPSADDVSERALGWLANHCFDPAFTGKRGCMDWAALYCCIALARKTRCVDFNAACRDIALAAHCTPTTAARSLWRLFNLGLLKRIGRRKMDQAQRYSLGLDLCIYEHSHPWVEITFAMFGVSRAAAKLQLFYTDTSQTHPQSEFATWTSVGRRALRVANARRGAAKRALRRKGLNSLEEAEDEKWRTAMWLWIVHERECWQEECWKIRSEKRRLRGQKGHLVIMKKYVPKEKVLCLSGMQSEITPK